MGTPLILQPKSSGSTIVVTHRINKIVVGRPQGLPGADGSGLSPKYTHTQVSPATTWIVNHNLGFKPSTTVLSVGGVDITASVQIIHISNNQIQILANPAVAGSAVVEG